MIARHRAAIRERIAIPLSSLSRDEFEELAIASSLLKHAPSRGFFELDFVAEGSGSFGEILGGALLVFGAAIVWSEVLIERFRP